MKKWDCYEPDQADPEDATTIPANYADDAAKALVERQGFHEESDFHERTVMVRPAGSSLPWMGFRVVPEAVVVCHAYPKE